jgi:hypothetical protein
MPIPKEATVNCLIDEQTRHWILETVNAFFDQHTIGQIIQIPICRGGERILCIGHIPRMVYTQFGPPTISLDPPNSSLLGVRQEEGWPLPLSMRAKVLETVMEDQCVGKDENTYLEVCPRLPS